MEYKLAFKSDDPSVSKDRWIASLSSGETVFDNSFRGSESGWRRLMAYASHHKLKITRLRLQAYGQFIQLPPSDEVQGYWYMNSMSGGIGNAAFDQQSKGVGYIRDNKVHITWVSSTGVVSNEIRDCKNNMLGALLND